MQLLQVTACRPGEPLVPTADAENVFISLINEKLITNSKKSRVSGASGCVVWGALSWHLHYSHPGHHRQRGLAK